MQWNRDVLRVEEIRRPRLLHSIRVWPVHRTINVVEFERWYSHFEISIRGVSLTVPRCKPIFLYGLSSDTLYCIQQLKKKNTLFSRYWKNDSRSSGRFRSLSGRPHIELLVSWCNQNWRVVFVSEISNILLVSKFFTACKKIMSRSFTWYAISIINSITYTIPIPTSRILGIRFHHF